MTIASSVPLIKIDDYRWQIPQSYKPGMRVPGLIFADEKILPKIVTDRSLEQVANVAHLPGIVNYSLAMPDIRVFLPRRGPRDVSFRGAKGCARQEYRA